ncbi:hypothetical protein BY996DRAFT_6504532 [Phakopsora pachyrhizi]|nr:hypothetical protein BY996DRAFT_6504532 [Phakopsora pachyrhizi]
MPRLQSSHYHSQASSKAIRAPNMAAIPAQHISSLSLKRRNQLASSAPSYQGLGNILISSESTPIAKSLGTARRSRQTTSKQTRKLKEKLPNSDLSGRISSPPNPQDETAQHTCYANSTSRSMSSSHHGEHDDEKPSTTPASMACSSDDADYTFARDSSFETKFYSRSSTPTPRHDDFATSQGYPGPLHALSSVSALHTSHRHHGLLDDHGKGPEAPQRFVKDDWDMPSVGISQDLTWQQLEKKLTKSIRLEIPDFGSSILKQRTPSANGALVGSAICSSFLINGKTPSTPDHQSAHSFSAPPSPSPDRVLASDLGLPMDMAHTRCSTSSDDVSLTWQQAIMRSPPKSHNSFPLHSSSADAQLELLEELKPYKKNAQLITVATLKTSAKNVSKKPEAHTLCKSVAGSQRDDRHRRRNSTSSTGYLSSQIPITAGKRSLNLKKCGFGEDAGAIKPCPLSNASEDKSTVLGKLSSSALPLGSSQSGNLVQVDQLANLKTINKDVPSSVCFINQLKSISHSSVSSAPLTGRYKENRLVTPNKARSTSELLQILTPTSASQSGPKGKGPMYAGPHFHNSPSPAALPAPKFSFGS